MENELSSNSSMSLQEFCDMDQLYRLIDNWSKSSGMSAVIVDTEGNRISDSFGMTEFCQMVHDNEKGMANCASTWKSDQEGIYVCPIGFCDFSIPIVLPDGQILGKVLAGQALSVRQNEEDILKSTMKLGIDEGTVKDVLSHVNKKTEREMKGSYELLKEMLNFFIDKNYSIWKTNNELKKVPAKKDRILSQITQIMYSYNLTVDLETESYTLITGTGMERTVDEYKKHNDYRKLRAFQGSIIHPAYLSRFNELTDFESARNNPSENGYRGSLEYPVLYPEDAEYEWHEINVFINTEEDGTRIANILGRDITETHNAQEKNEKELRAAAAKNQILSELTKMLYSYNLTVNLQNWKYSLITGTGMNNVLEILQHSDDFVLIHAKLLQGIASEDKEKIENLVGIQALQKRMNKTGYIGTVSCRVPMREFDEWHEVNLFMGTNEDGVPVANILGRDITEAHEQQEAKERELKASAAKDQILSDITKTLYSYNATVNLNTGKYSLIIGTGMEEIIQHFSRTDDYEKACEYLLEKALPEYPEEMNRRFSLNALREQQNQRGHLGQIEYAAVTENGIGWYEVNAFMGVDEEGNPTANILGRDVTEIHEAQERRENELKAVAAKDQILSNITKTLYSYNLTLNLESGKYSLIVGTGMKDFVEIFESTDDYETAYWQKIRYVTEDCLERFGNFSSLTALRNRKNENGYIGNLEYSIKTDKGIEWHEINIFLGTDENGASIANILGRDITEAHEKADTKAQLEIANASNAAKSAFLFNMSHDIRTPMNAIIGFTELLEKHLDDKELSKDYVKKIRISNEFLLALINNVLEMARIESGKTTLDETYCNAYAFNDSLYALFDSQMKEKGIEFTRFFNVEHAEVICDETKLREIFLNILSNALKYTPPGGKVTMKLTEVPSDRPGYAMYRTEIADTGIGMSEEFIPHLFEEFTRERSSTESKLNGMGLGMAIVKKLVDLMQGTIEVESQIGKGTKFTITLPHRIAANRDVNPLLEKAEEYVDGYFKGRRILLAEDNELNAEIAITILEEAGFEVEYAADGIICVDMMEKADAGYYDLILMDIQMPNMDGYKATQTIRKFSDPKKAGITIVAMTANAFDEDKKNAYKAGMNGHLAKPIKVAELMSALTEILKE